MRLATALEIPRVIRALFSLRKVQRRLDDSAHDRLGLQWLEEWAAPRAITESLDYPEEHERLRAETWYEAIRLATRLPFWRADEVPACLPRSMVLLQFLRAEGIHAELKLGICKREQALASHAWVEINQIMVGEPDTVASDFVAVDLSHWLGVQTDKRQNGLSGDRFIG